MTVPLRGSEEPAADGCTGVEKGVKPRRPVLDVGTPRPTRRQMLRNRVVLFLRKEVIQPHLPVRLPCYDFTPIANPTFDGSLPKGLGHRLRVLPTFVV